MPSHMRQLLVKWAPPGETVFVSHSHSINDEDIGPGMSHCPTAGYKLFVGAGRVWASG